MTARQLKLGAVLIGVGTAPDAWRDPDVPGDASIDIDWYRAKARLAEDAKFDFVFIVDSPYITPDSAPHFLNRLEPLTLLSALAGGTSRIGLVGTLTTSYSEPFNVARQFGSLDLISHGRAGWNVVTTGLEGAAGNYGRERHYDHGERYRRAAEHLGVVRGLWDSYEDDAFPRDKAAGRFLDPSRQHALGHRGEFYSVAGPLNISRSAQGQPVIFQAGSSDAGRDLAARTADAIFSMPESFDEAVAFRADIRRRAEAAGRDPDSILVFPGLQPILRATDAEAEAEWRRRAESVDLHAALVQLGRPFGYHDFTRYDPDAPFPDLGDAGSNAYRSHSERIRLVARAEGLTLRETALRLATPRSDFIGSASTVADQVERWFRGGAADGFNVGVGRARDLDEFAAQVVPLLQARGLFRHEYEDTTLRGNLGLAVPVNRHTAARRAEAERQSAGQGASAGVAGADRTEAGAVGSAREVSA
ncbi:LLM class flavin-dependent oxidoreductase [Derxia gummosa]|uniref:LLM class flavin-dependent oxidoreductase n=1 Tax=Derxia gummosa DSM 723 TaxID=1121388 RepID=A0A8B6XBD6_9BURK|nr:LLM class flavin-dependent oxidoreductase [Derxia gummosa]